MGEDQGSDGSNASWTIKRAGVEDRKLAIRCAGKRGQTVAEWIGAAVRNQARLEDGDRVIPPESASRPYPLPTAPGIALDDLALALQGAEAAARASGLPMPRKLARHAFALIEGNLRTARGLPPLAPPLRRARPVMLERGLPEDPHGFAQAET